MKLPKLRETSPLALKSTVENTGLGDKGFRPQGGADTSSPAGWRPVWLHEGGWRGCRPCAAREPHRVVLTWRDGEACTLPAGFPSRRLWRNHTATGSPDRDLEKKPPTPNVYFSPQEKNPY